MQRDGYINLVTLILALALLVAELIPAAESAQRAAWLLDYLLLFLLAAELVSGASAYSKITDYLRHSILPLFFLLLFLLLFLYSRLLPPTAGGHIAALSRGLLAARSLLLLLGVFRRLRRLSVFFETVTLHPAQTILYSFLGAILTGTLLLMLPFTTPGSAGLDPLSSLFTATSAVCVTGLVVVEPVTGLSFWGQLIVLLLIQAGGLGIMIISYFSLFAARQKVSLEEKMILSYILEEQNMNALAGRVRAIIYTTVAAEAAGTALLFHSMREAAGGATGEGLFYALFHSVSAFCNAGFALFTDSLQGFASDPSVTVTTAGLIIMGGLSFSVLANAGESLFGALRSRLRGTRPAAREEQRSGRNRRLSLNSRTVLQGSAVLLAAGMLLFYLFAHGGVLASLPTGAQYLHAFFQSVTLRTAGFSTVDIGSLSLTALLIMLPFMFIGGASGGTAGGIKINNAAIITAYIGSTIKGKDSVVISRYSVSRDRVNRAFLIFFFGITAAGAGTVLLSITEPFALERILFEAVSAFGTVGLSTGITAEISPPGRLVIIVLMFIGRVGPLTILAAAAKPGKRVDISYPEGDILI